MDNENQRVKLTKRLLRDALLSMMETKQIQQISVRELCEKAEINRSTFYKHYGAPENIFQEIQQELTMRSRALSMPRSRARAPMPMLMSHSKAMSVSTSCTACCSPARPVRRTWICSE